MLYLNPPFFSIEGVVVVGDYSDPRQFFYYPNRPRIAVDEEGRPAIRFLVYKENLSEIAGGDEAAAGFLFFDTSIAWPEETLKKVATKLKNDLQLNDMPRLTPLLYRSGKVRLTFLDRRSTQAGDVPPPAGGDASPREDWVTSLEAPSTPSLYGENRAMFSVALTKKAAELMLASFDGFIPAGVIYEMQYVAMQRAFNVKVEANWELVYHFIREYEENRVFFFSDETEKIVEKLEEKKIIKITASLEGVGDEGMEGEFNEVRKQLGQFVFEKFFEPKINPRAVLDKDVPGGIIDFISGSRKALHLVNLGSTKRTLDVSQIRTLSVDYTVTKAVERIIAPQGHLSVFWEDFAPKLTKEDVVTVVTSEEDMWRVVALEVHAVADFAADAVDRIAVDIAYGPMQGDRPAPGARTFSLMLDASTKKGTVRGWYDPALGTTFHYRYTVAFGPDAIVGRDVVLTSPWKEAEGAITVNPGELYRERSVEFQRSRLVDPLMFPEVLVHIRYTDPRTGWVHETSGLVSDAKASWNPKFRIAADAPEDVEYRTEYLRAGGGIEQDWQTTRDEMVLLEDPRKNLFKVKVLVADRTNFEQAVIGLEYSDPEHDIFEMGSMTISKEKVNEPHEWSFPREVPAHSRYRYSQVLIDTTGNVTFTGWVQSEANTLLVGNVFARKWEIRPQIIGPAFAENGVERIKLALHYHDRANQFQVDKDAIFSGPGSGEPLPLELRDPSARDYTYDLRYVMRNGFERKVGPLSSSDTFLVISSVPPVA